MVTTAGKRGYTVEKQDIYGVPPFPTRRASRGDHPHRYNSTRNSYAEPRSGGTVTSQSIPYQLKHIGNGAIGTYDCDHEQHAGATQYSSGSAKKLTSSKKK